MHKRAAFYFSGYNQSAGKSKVEKDYVGLRRRQTAGCVTPLPLSRPGSGDGTRGEIHFSAFVFHHFQVYIRKEEILVRVPVHQVLVEEQETHNNSSQ